MILRYLLFIIFCLVLVTASDPFFGTDLSFKKVPKEDPSDVQERPWMSTDAFRVYLEDRDERVNDTFTVKPFFYPSVNFWFMIYTQFESSSVVIHDKKNLSIIYKVLDFSSLYIKNLPKNTLHVLQQKLSLEYVNDLRKDLVELEKDPFSLSLNAKAIYRTLKHSKVQLPVLKNDRIKFFKSLRENLRTQTGQKDFIRSGMVRSGPYFVFLDKYFTDRELPKELLAVPFLESSFNPRAHSRVNALGIWQFMPFIAAFYLPKKTHQIDYRSNVGVASVSAANLMADNFQIMKTWDLTVPAYNSGTKHLLKTKRSLGSKDVDLEDIIKHSDSAHFGFASKNFYSEFLALVHTLAYREELFPDIHDSERADANEILRFYYTKCSLKLPSVLNNEALSDVDFHNDQLQDLKTSLPRGSIITTKTELPKKSFLEIPYEVLVKYRPSRWDRFLGNQSCSTR